MNRELGLKTAAMAAIRYLEGAVPVCSPVPDITVRWGGQGLVELGTEALSLDSAPPVGEQAGWNTRIVEQYPPVLVD